MWPALYLVFMALEWKNPNVKIYWRSYIRIRKNQGEHIAARRPKGFGISDGILAILDEIPLGKHKHWASSQTSYADKWDTVQQWGMAEHIWRRIQTAGGSRQSFNKKNIPSSLKDIYLLSTPGIRNTASAVRISQPQTYLLLQHLVQSRLWISPKSTESTNAETHQKRLVQYHKDISNFDEERIKSMQSKSYKRFIKKKIRQAAFEYLEADKSKKSKVTDFNYKKFSIQKYVTSTKFTDEDV